MRQPEGGFVIYLVLGSSTKNLCESLLFTKITVIWGAAAALFKTYLIASSNWEISRAKTWSLCASPTPSL